MIWPVASSSSAHLCRPLTEMDSRVIFDLAVAEPVDGVVVISIVGELDMSTAPRLREELIRVASATDSPRVVLDLAGTDLLDPTGLGVIFDGVKRTRSRGGDLALARAEAHVLRDLELTRVIEILPAFDSVSEAIQSIAL
ncbi:MAG: anti-sigma factor antagonist [Actinobacteria bacterium]|nr:anti-sigma factor antagonist [Actinomycetota bacterium]